MQYSLVNWESYIVWKQQIDSPVLQAEIFVFHLITWVFTEDELGHHEQVHTDANTQMQTHIHTMDGCPYTYL